MRKLRIPKSRVRRASLIFTSAMLKSVAKYGHSNYINEFFYPNSKLSIKVGER